MQIPERKTKEPGREQGKQQCIVQSQHSCLADLCSCQGQCGSRLAELYLVHYAHFKIYYLLLWLKHRNLVLRFYLLNIINIIKYLVKLNSLIPWEIKKNNN